MEVTEIHQKMHLFDTHHGESRSDWHKVMENVFDNFNSMYSIGRKKLDGVNLLYGSGFQQLYYRSSLFMRCMLKWCVEDGRINRDFVDILTDVETYIADTVRFILQYVGTAPESFDGKDFSNIDHLLPRMAKACLHVLTADSSPPNFNISYDSFHDFGEYLMYGSWACLGPLRSMINMQITKVRALRDFVYHTRDKINHGNGQELLISLESVYDKVACNVFLGCWESYYMYLSGPNINMDTLFDASIRKVSTLHLDMYPVAIWTDEILKAYIDSVQQSLKRLPYNIGSDLTPVVYQLKMLCIELLIIVNFNSNYPPQPYAEGPSQVDVRVEVQAFARGIDSIGFLYLTTQTKDINLVIAEALVAREKLSLGLRNFSAPIIKDRVMRITSCMPVPLTHEFLIKFMERVQQFMSQITEDESIVWKKSLERTLRVIGILVNFHKDYPLRYYAEPMNVADGRVEVQNVARSIESFIYSVITQNEDHKLVVDAASKIIIWLRNLAALFFKAWVTSWTTLPLTDERLIQFMDYVQRCMSQIIPTCPEKDKVECLHHELGILKKFHINYPLELYNDEGPNLVDVRAEVLAVARNIGYFVYSTFTTPTEEYNVDAAGLQNLLVSILKTWMLQLTSCVILPLTDELLVQFMECVQRFLSRMLKDKNIIPRGPSKDQVKFLCKELGILVHFHINYPPQLYAKEWPNQVAVRLEVQKVVRYIASFIIQTEENKDLDDATTKIIPELQSLLAFVLKTWILQLTSCTTLPMTDEVLLQFMECAQRFLSRMLKDENIIHAHQVSVQLEFLQYELGILVHFHINYPPHFYAEEGPNLVSVRVEVQKVAWNTASFIYSSLIIQTKQDATEIIFGLHNLLASIFNAWAGQFTRSFNHPYVDELPIQWKDRLQLIMDGTLEEESFALTVASKHQLETQDDSMGFLPHMLFKYKPNHSADKEKPCNIRIQVLVRMRTIAPNINTFIDDRAKEYLGPTMSFLLSDLIKKVAHLKAEVMDIIFLTLVCRLRRVIPRTVQLGFFNFLIDNTKQLVSSGSDLICEWKGEMQTIHEALLLFRDFFQSLTDDSNAKLHDICECVVNVAYEAEYFIYSLYDGSYPTACINIWISHIAQDVEKTKVAVLDIFEKKEQDGGITIHDSSVDQNHISPHALIPTIDLVVGFEDEMQHVKQQLVASQHVKQLDVVSVIGMPGLGKTTLARKVYEDRQIVGHFQIRAWCVVSNEYNKKDLLLTILGCIVELTDMTRKKNEVELSTLLHKQLMGRRYLVVMDDVWGIDAFEFLKVFLPDNKNGSRILLTTRNKVIGLKAKHHSDLLELRTLTNEESWFLLSQKIYRNQECPLDLCQVGKRIAENCRGLPLAVVLVAGLLAKSDKTREFWEQVAENLTSYMAHDSQTQGMAVLELSYKHLPPHLKPMFLYIGAFPEDKEVPIEKLIWLWIAEGFVNDTKLGSLEVQAESYLMDLIDRSFLMVAAIRSDGRVKTCIVHDLLRDMCLLKAKEEHLLQQINVSDDLPDPISYQKRLSILLQRRKEGTPTHLISDGVLAKPFITYEDLSTLSLIPPLYSLLLFNKNRRLPLWKEAVESVFRDLRLLRVLHLESTSIDANLCDDIMMLVHLRYISVRATWTSIPSSISKLRNLETLIIKGLRGEIKVPEEIWELVKLRHLHVNDRAKFSVSGDKSSVLENLETVSTPTICHGEEEKLMRRLPNVRKLRCVFFESWNPHTKCYPFPQLESPDQLESLKVIYGGTTRCSGPFVVPLTLKKLSLSRFRLKWEEVSLFQKLPELEILNLRVGTVDGEFWDMDDDEEEEEGFLKLKVLKLEGLNIKRWSVCADKFPSLEKLVLNKCKQLKEIPNELGEINSLQKIEVLWCNNSAVISAKLIEKEQKYAGNESLERTWFNWKPWYLSKPLSLNLCSSISTRNGREGNVLRRK